MRVALIEVGHWHAARHARSLHVAGAAIVGVSDRQPGVAARFATQWACPAFEDYQEMLVATRPEFVMAMGRHADMPAIARDLIEAQLPFAIEKPIGISAEQVAPLVDLAHKHDAFVAVPLTNRYSELWAWLGRLDHAGRAGPRVHAHCRIVNGPPHRYERDNVPWMLDPAISGGGAMRNLGIHAVDAFLHFVDGEAVEVLSAATTYRVYGKAVEEMGAALLRSASGVIGTVEAGYTFAAMSGGDFEMRVAAANCYLIDRGDRLRVATLDDGQNMVHAIPDQGARYDQFGRDTLARLRSGQRPIATIEDCYRAMCVLDEIYHRAVRTPFEQGAPDG
jgi:predicted dehydrogenase